MTSKTTKLDKTQYITSYNFSSFCDIVYSETVTHAQAQTKKTHHTFTLNTTETHKLYKNSVFEIKENDIIFCNTYMIDPLFKKLRGASNLKNIKLITNQTDLRITKKIFRKKPECVSEWYSINVDFNDPKLIPIPLGLANEYDKNLNVEDFKNYRIKDIQRIKNLYLNFQENTNYFHRTSVKKYFKKIPESVISDSNLKKKDYFKELTESTYIICPKGNGIDTHRIWESLYAGAIPVVEKNINFEKLKIPNVVLVDNFKKIKNLKHIDELYEDQKNESSSNRLTIEFWMNIINKNRVDSSETFSFKDSLDENLRILENFENKIHKERNYKTVKTFIRKILNKFYF